MHKVGGVTGGTSFDYLQTKFASLTFHATLETYFIQCVSPREVDFLLSEMADLLMVTEGRRIST